MPTDLNMPKDSERVACRTHFGRMLDRVRAEVERQGHHTVVSVLAEMDEIIDGHDDRNR
jgi:hypothetical protein